MKSFSIPTAMKARQYRRPKLRLEDECNPSHFLRFPRTRNDGPKQRKSEQEEGEIWQWERPRSREDEDAFFQEAVRRSLQGTSSSSTEKSHSCHNNDEQETLFQVQSYLDFEILQEETGGCQDEEDWEEVSAAGSNVKVFTYRDALLCVQNITMGSVAFPVPRERKKVREYPLRCQKLNKNFAEDEEATSFDAHFIREGVKECRGRGAQRFRVRQQE